MPAEDHLDLSDSLAELEVSQWKERLSALDRRVLVRAAIDVVKTVLPEWIANRPGDRRPLKAVEAAEGFLARPDDDARAYAQAAARACTAARKDSLGHEHRIAEAARSVARATVARSLRASLEAAVEAISRAEEQILYRYAVEGVYQKELEVRSELLSVIRKTVSSTQPVRGDAQDGSRVEPVDYSASMSFDVGQWVSHRQFGICRVIGTTARWIEIEAQNGDRRKLAHRRS